MKFTQLKCKRDNENFINFPLILIFLIIISVMSSCIKEEEFNFKRIAAFDYNPNMSVPLVHSELTLKDVLNDYDKDNLFVEDGTNFLYLIYKSNIFSKRADEIITIANQNNNTNFNFSIGTIPIGDSASAINNTIYTFSSDFNERYDSIRIKSGSLIFNLNTNLNHNARIYISIPNAKKSGKPFKKAIDINYSGIPVNISKAFDLAGYTLNFSTGNKIAINYTVTVYGDGNSNLPSYSVNMNESFQNIAYSSIFGYLGKRNFLINQDSVLIEIFKNTTYGTVHFVDPRIYIYANNSFGMPFAVSFDKFEAISKIKPPFVLPVTSTELAGKWNVGYPTFAQFGQITQTPKTLDKSNSNIIEAIELLPRWVTYHIQAESNPSGNINDNNFAIDTSRFNVDVEVELPMHGSAYDFRLQDTIKAELGEDIDQAEWVKFKINTENKFPVDAVLQIYFTDSLYQKIDSLFAPGEQVLSAAPIGPGPDYRITSTSKKTIEAIVYKNKLTKLKNTDRILIYSKLATINNGNNIVKFYSDYTIAVDIGIQIQGQFQVNLNK